MTTFGPDLSGIRAYLMDRVAEIARGDISVDPTNHGETFATVTLARWMPVIASEVSAILDRAAVRNNTTTKG